VGSRFGISGIVDSVGEPVQVISVGRSYDVRGDLSGATYSYSSLNGVVQVMSAVDEEVQEGVLQPEDIIAFFDVGEAESVSGVLKAGNLVSGAFESGFSREYEIKEVIRNLGHYEVHASKL